MYHADVRIDIKGDNAAFDDSQEYARILRGILQEIEDGEAHSHGLYDINGNECGNVWYRQAEGY